MIYHSRHIPLSISSFILAMAIGLNSYLGAEIQYTLTDLGPVSPHTISMGKAVNDKSQATGVSVDAESQKAQAVLWNPNSKPQLLGNSDIVFSSAKGINNLGAVVGRARVEHGKVRAFVWTPKNGMQFLPSLRETFSSACGINNEGVVVGTADIGNKERHAMIWVPGKSVRDLGTLGGSFSNAKAINTNGQVVGRAGLSNGDGHAYIWDADKGMRDLGTLGGKASGARSINDVGQIVGYSTDDDGKSHAVLWGDGPIKDLGNLGDNFSIANSINNAGQVVGVTGSKTLPKAFIWDKKNGIRDLEPLVEDAKEWRFYIATSINNRGEIVGTGQHKGHFRAFLLSPIIEEPAPIEQPAPIKTSKKITEEAPKVIPAKTAVGVKAKAVAVEMIAPVHKKQKATVNIAPEETEVCETCGAARDTYDGIGSAKCKRCQKPQPAAAPAKQGNSQK